MLDHIQADLKTSMLSRDSARTGVLRMALAAYKNEAVAKGLGPQGVLAEADALVVLKRLLKSREESAEQFDKAGQGDRANLERAEIQILKAYLPAMLEGPALEDAVRAAIQATEAASRKDMGRVMKELQARHGGAFDGKTASQVIQSLLP